MEYLFCDDTCVQATLQNSKFKTDITDQSQIKQAYLDVLDEKHIHKRDQYIKDICIDVLFELLKKRKIPIYYSKIKISDQNQIFHLYILSPHGKLHSISALYENYISSFGVDKEPNVLDQLNKRGFVIGSELWDQDPEVTGRKQKTSYSSRDQAIRAMVPEHWDSIAYTRLRTDFEQKLSSYRFEYRISHIAKKQDITEVTLETNYVIPKMYVLFWHDQCIQTDNQAPFSYWGAEKQWLNEPLLREIWNKVRLKIATRIPSDQFRYYKQVRMKLATLKIQRKPIYLAGFEVYDFYIKTDDYTFTSIFDMISDLFLHRIEHNNVSLTAFQIADLLRQKGYEVIQINRHLLN